MLSFHDIVCAVLQVPARVSGLMAGKARICAFGKGERLVEQGCRCNDIFFLAEGICRSLYEEDGKEDTRWFATEGDVVTSLTAIHRREPAIFSIEAITPVKCYAIGYSDMEELLEREDDIKRWALEIFAESLYVLERRYVIIGTGDARSLYEALLKGRPQEMLNCIPLKYIAQYLKITQETLSRVRKAYAKI